MAEYRDLSEYTYTRMHMRPFTRNVGWLGREIPFPTAAPSPELLDVIWSYCGVSVASYRGDHICEFCDDYSGRESRHGSSLWLGSAEIRAFSGEQIFAAPNLIYHYIETHHYEPPNEFLDAINTSPGPPTPEYFARLSTLNLSWHATTVPPKNKHLTAEDRRNAQELGIPIGLYGLPLDIKARLRWLPLARDTFTGRPRRFQLPARFDDQANKNSGQYFKLVVELQGDVDSEGNQLAAVGFRLWCDPDEWLSIGAKFTLFDGSEAVAEGEIIAVA